jgi:hypothetical protein
MRRDIVQLTLDHLKKYQIERMVLSPKFWSECKVPVTLNWTVVKYDKTQRNKLPEKKGIYTFIVKPGIVGHPECAYLLYVGQTEAQNFKKRFTQYFNEERKPKGREHIKVMARLWRKHLWYCYAPVDNVTLIEEIENKLIKAFVPPFNRKFPGVLGKAKGAWS